MNATKIPNFIDLLKCKHVHSLPVPSFPRAQPQSHANCKTRHGMMNEHTSDNNLSHIHDSSSAKSEATQMNSSKRVACRTHVNSRKTRPVLGRFRPARSKKAFEHRIPSELHHRSLPVLPPESAQIQQNSVGRGKGLP